MKRREFLWHMAAMPLIRGPLVSAQTSQQVSTRGDLAVRAAPALAAAPSIDIGSDRQLFVDGFLVDQRQGVALKLHRPTSQEVVLRMERPWEGETSWCSVVMKDGDKYRMWYRVAPYTDIKLAARVKVEWWNYTAYAESSDGIHWERPNLGLYEFQGSKENNLVWKGPGGNMSVLKDEKPDVPSDQRYKAMTRAGGAFGLVSPDGIRWRLLQDKPLLTGGHFDSHNIIFQDPWTGQYTYYGRGFLPTEDEVKTGSSYGVRRIRRATSEDFIHWTPLEYIDMGKEPMDHLYTNAATPYWRARGIYLMFPMRFVPERTFDKNWPQEGQSDIVFASSRDGIHWDRTFLEAFIRPGLDPENWHERSIAMGQGLVQTGPTELSLYYFEHFRTRTCRIRRCTIRPDGFVSVNAPYAGGEFVTKPLVFRGRNLWINYSTSAVGFVQVEIQDASGKPVAGYTLAESTKIFGDELDRAVTWTSRSDVDGLQNQPVRLRFIVKDADLYSFRFGDA